MKCFTATRALSAALLILCSAPAASAAVITNSAFKDATLYEDPQGSIANGAGDYLFTGTTAIGTTLRGLVHFDLTENIPPGVIITNARLSLYMSRTIAGSTLVSLHQVNAEWGEGASDASGQEGAGALALNGDATWLHTFYSNAFWSTPGGVFSTQASAATSVAGNGYYTWQSPQLATDVQAWLDNSALNFGWLIRGDESSSTTAKRFNTRENPSSATRPMLIVAYVIPEPGFLSGCVLIGGLALYHRRR